MLCSNHFGFKVVLQLTTDLDAQSERDRNCLTLLLAGITTELEINKPNLENIAERTNQREVQLVIMRFLSMPTSTLSISNLVMYKLSLVGVLMSRCKTTSTTKPSPQDNSVMVSQTTATVLHKAGVIAYCLKLLQSLLEYWHKSEAEEAGIQIGGNLLKPHLTHAPPDMTPFFLKQFVKGAYVFCKKKQPSYC